MITPATRDKAIYVLLSEPPVCSFVRLMDSVRMPSTFGFCFPSVSGHLSIFRLLFRSFDVNCQCHLSNSIPGAYPPGMTCPPGLNLTETQWVVLKFLHFLNAPLGFLCWGAKSIVALWTYSPLHFSLPSAFWWSRVVGMHHPPVQGE